MTRVNLAENIWHDPEATNYIMLDVTDQIPLQLPQTIDGVELMPKDEYHISLVAAGKLSDNPREVATTIEAVREYLGSIEKLPEFVTLGAERYRCRKGDEVTLIAPAKIIGLDGLREVVKVRYPDYAPPFPHVTLLKSANSPYGIGINSSDDFELYCTRWDSDS